MNTVESLNQKFGRQGIAFKLGNQDLPKATLRNADGSSAEIYLHGAHLTSWKSAEGTERLFVSRRAIFAAEKPIRGGVPLVFPQFGNGTLPAHGLARTRSWQVVDTKLADGGPSITLRFESTPETKALWTHDFSVDLTVSLREGLHAEVAITNKGTQVYSFQWAFHTYFAVRSITNTFVRDLAGVRYLDNLKAREAAEESASLLAIDKEIDRIYCQAPDYLEIVEESNPRYAIEKQGLPDAVVWNPWIERSKAIADLEPQEYQHFLCVECGLVEHPYQLSPAETYRGFMSLKAS